MSALVLTVCGLATSERLAMATPGAVAGDLTMDAADFDLTGAVFDGTWNPAVGTLAGGFTFPATTHVDAGFFEFDVRVEQGASGTGGVDLGSNEAHFDAVLELYVFSIGGEDDFPTHALEGCNYLLPVAMTGTFNPATGVVSLSDASATSVPAVGRICYSAIFGGTYAGETDPLFATSSWTFDASIDLGTQIPNAPTIIRNATAANAEATVSWTAPASDGGSAITGYVVTPYVGYSPRPSQTFGSTLTTQTLTGLTNGTQYRLRVQAINAIGTSGYSTVTNPVTPTAPTPPGQPTIIQNATAGNGEATVSWIAPVANGGSLVTGYVVTPYVGYSPRPSQTFGSTLTTQTLTGLTNGTQYRFRVQAINAIGTGGYSTVTNPVTPSA